MILPEKYNGLSEDELASRISKVKEELGEQLVILGHHYQRDEVYQFADFVGDSFKLAQDAASVKNAKYIIFCGVHFMAEAARIVCSNEQRVFLPDMEAGCPMADLATADEVELAWEAISSVIDTTKVIPITYMNSTAAIKAFCGRMGGIVCTSSNAGRAFEWAFSKGDKILFLPDEHLGRNTAREKGVDRKLISLWKRDLDDGGLTRDEIEKSKVIVWNGFCHVHTHFTTKDIARVRRDNPGAKIIVHPECTEDVVMLSDAAGSTEQIKQYVEAAEPGSTIAVGTEVNMVNRLANANMDKKVFPLSRSLCPNMFKISLNDLCWTLEELGDVNEIIVEDDVARDAKRALERMLSL